MATRCAGGNEENTTAGMLTLDGGLVNIIVMMFLILVGMEQL